MAAPARPLSLPLGLKGPLLDGFETVLTHDALAFVALGRLSALRTDIAVLKAHGEDVERDVKLDLAASRRDQQEAAQHLRSELGERLTQLVAATQQQFRDFDERLGRFAQLTQDQLRHHSELNESAGRTTAERLDRLRVTSEERLEAVRATVEQRLDVLLLHCPAAVELPAQSEHVLRRDATRRFDLGYQVPKLRGHHLAHLPERSGYSLASPPLTV